MSLKSMFSYGKYEGYTVSNVMKVDPIWLAWAYYNYDRISFIDEILDYLQVKRISKPGKNPKMGLNWYNKMDAADINDTGNSLSEIKRRFLANQAGKESSREIAKKDPNLRRRK